ncbi:MAG: hypothetical protein J6D11_04655 [Clostridia bacterium]|nr:hypothetical protein [Clostridia bacterium]
MADDYVMPFLPRESFGWHFAWDERSYTALINRESCINFSCDTWNALVYNVNQKLKMLFDQDVAIRGESPYFWNEIYASADDTLIGFDEAGNAAIYDPYNRLTAKKFNSLRHNIDAMAPPGYTNWSWEYNKNREGYVGKRDFLSGDKVYAWYILELVRKLDLITDIWMNTANFSDLIQKQNSKTLCKFDLRSFRALDFAVVNSFSNTAAGFRAAIPSPLFISHSACSSSIDKLAAIATANMPVSFISSSSSLDALKALQTLRFGVKHGAKSTSADKFAPLPTAPLLIRHIATSASSDMLLTVPTASINIQYSSISGITAIASLAHTRLMRANIHSNSETRTALFSAGAKYLSFEDICESTAEILALALPAEPFYAICKDQSANISRLIPTLTIPQRVQYNSQSQGQTTLLPTLPKSINVKSTGESFEKCIFAPVETKPFCVFTASESASNTLLQPGHIKPVLARKISESAQKSALIKLSALNLPVKNTSESRDSTSLKSVPVLSAKAAESSRSSESAALMFHVYAMLYGADIERTIHKAEISFKESARLSSYQSSKTIAKGTFDVQIPLGFKAKNTSKGAHSANIYKQRSFGLTDVCEISRTLKTPPDLCALPQIKFENKSISYADFTADFECFPALHLSNTAQISKSSHLSDANAFKGIIFESTDFSSSKEAGEIALLPPFRLTEEERSASLVLAQPASRKSAKASAFIASVSAHTASLELEAPEIDWIYPIVSETDVFIQQVYLAIQDEDGVHIE